MTRTMYDSTTIADIPEHATMIGAYIDGRYANHDAAQRRFPHATIVTITVTGEPRAHVVDCEPGDLTPQHAALWAQREHLAGRHPTIYCMASQWGAVKRAVAALDLTGSDVSYWIADYDGDPTIPAGAVAKQYANQDITGHHFDRSSVAGYWPGVDPEPSVILPHPKRQRPNRALLLALIRLIRRFRKGTK